MGVHSWQANPSARAASKTQNKFAEIEHLGCPACASALYDCRKYYYTIIPEIAENTKLQKLNRDCRN
jgi:hypothetical protein